MTDESDEFFKRFTFVGFSEAVPMSKRLKSGNYPSVYTQRYNFRLEMLRLLSSSLVIKHLIDGFKDFELR